MTSLSDDKTEIVAKVPDDQSEKTNLDTRRADNSSSSGS